jgi:hypothetical protein
MLAESTSTHRTVQNAVINALLEALFDILDLDGKKSILMFAGLEQWIDQKLPTDGVTAWDDFLRLIGAMRMLLQYSDSILYEVGRKFSIYLDPFGSSVPDFLNHLNRSFVDLEITYEQPNNHEYLILMRWDGRDSDLFDDKWMQCFYQGLFTEGMRKAVGGNVKMELLDASNIMIKFRIYTE